jgi:energy-coupling factor transporter ATP-binding protein EcfA2
MAITIRKAVKFDAKLRMALAGPSGSGKTFTALTLAHALAGDKGVIVIDTERGSASKYADMFPEFDVIDLDNFHPNIYIEAIQAAEQGGYGVLVIDSLSHAWNGPGGLLEIVEQIAKRNQNKSTFNAWGEATPLQNRLIDAITRSNLHVICTMRSKTEYVVEINEKGKSAPRKVGTAPVQRQDVEYEFDVYADMTVDNEMIVHKSRCSVLAGQVISKPDASVAEVLKAWLSGAPAPVRRVTKERLNELYTKGKRAGLYANAEEFAIFVQLTLNLDAPVDLKFLTEDQARDVETTIVQRQQQAQQPSQQQTPARAS